jgi:hypothetical protein
MLEDKHWEKRINFTTHDFPHARYLHSTCDFFGKHEVNPLILEYNRLILVTVFPLGLEVSESNIPSEFESLFSTPGIDIVEKLLRYFGDKSNFTKKHTLNVQDNCSSARQILFLRGHPLHIPTDVFNVNNRR